MEYKNITGSPLSIRGVLVNPGEVVDSPGYLTDNARDILVMRQSGPDQPTHFIYRFFLDDGMALAQTAYVYAGSILESPPTPVSVINPEYEFIGWYDNLAGTGSPTVFPYTVTGAGNRDFYSKFRTEPQSSYTVTFMLDDGITVYDSITIDSGASINKPTIDPTSLVHPEYYFDGWYTDISGTGNKIIFPYYPTADTILYSKFSEEMGEYAPEYPLNTYMDWTINTLKLPVIGTAEDKKYYQLYHPDGCPFEDGDELEVYYLFNIIQDMTTNAEHGGIIIGTLHQLSPTTFEVLEFKESVDHSVFMSLYVGYKYESDELVEAELNYVVLEVYSTLVHELGFIAFDYPRQTYFVDDTVTPNTTGIRYIRAGQEYVSKVLPGEYTEYTVYYKQSTTKTWEFDLTTTEQGSNFTLIEEMYGILLYRMVLSLDEYPNNHGLDYSCMLITLGSDRGLGSHLNISPSLFMYTGRALKDYQQMLVLLSEMPIAFIGGSIDILTNPDMPVVIDELYDEEGRHIRYPVSLYLMLEEPIPINFDIKIDFTSILRPYLDLPYNTESMAFDSIGYVGPNLNDVVLVERVSLSVYEIFKGDVGLHENFDSRSRIVETLQLVEDVTYGLCIISDNVRILFNRGIESGVLVEGNDIVVQILNNDIAYVTFDFNRAYFRRICENGNKGLVYRHHISRGTDRYLYIGNTGYSQYNDPWDYYIAENVPDVVYDPDTQYLVYLYYGYDDPCYIKKLMYDNGTFYITDPKTNTKRILEIQVGKYIDTDGVVTDNTNTTLFSYYSYPEGQLAYYESIFIESPNHYDIDSRSNTEFSSVSVPGFYNEYSLNIVSRDDFDINSLTGKSLTLHYIYDDYTQGQELITFMESEITDGEGNYAIEATNAAGSVRVLYDATFDSGEIQYIKEGHSQFDNTPLHIGLLTFNSNISPNIRHIMFNTTDYGINNYYNTRPFYYCDDE